MKDLFFEKSNPPWIVVQFRLALEFKSWLVAPTVNKESVLVIYFLLLDTNLGIRKTSGRRRLLYNTTYTTSDNIGVISRSSHL